MAADHMTTESTKELTTQSTTEPSMATPIDDALSPFSTGATNERGQPLYLPDDRQLIAPPRTISAITLGAGARGNVYGNFALAYPEHLSIVGVADPSDLRRQAFAERHGVPDAARFTDWADVFRQPKFADAIIVSTPDHMHFEPCMAALEAGYDVLLEKPIAPSEAECRALLDRARASGRIVAVCHVLRYAPYFTHMRTLIRSGAVGRLVSIQHMEPIGHVHMAHSYVRGNWRRSEQTSPIILAKSSHDLDILRWLADRPVREVQAFGALSWFTADNAPDGSTERCTGGCTVEATCPYSAKRIYLEQRQRLYVFDLAAEEPARSEDILGALETTDYGRCVYRMDNNQCDHYTVNLRFDDEITATLSLEAFTPWSGRRTRVMGSHGYLDGDMQRLEAHDFRTGEVSTWTSDVVEDTDDAQSGHGGGDWRLVADFVQAVAHQDMARLTSTIDQSIESHLMAFAAERSRASRTVERVSL
jgi:predicted dehydrogenase